MATCQMRLITSPPAVARMREDADVDRAEQARKSCVRESEWPSTSGKRSTSAEQRWATRRSHWNRRSLAVHGEDQPTAAITIRSGVAEEE
ncbi:hypothetical protein [Kitasatospora nipponensis]|uniref:hypothetical protein n=1 Tax=Kitasatospora nipponensis TaxID=258049 RepID=UPI0031D37A58